MAKKKCTADELIGANARVVIGPLTSNEMYVKGLNSYTLPDMSREEITISDFETDFDGKVPGGGTYGNLTFSGNLISGDPTQDTLQVRLEKNTSFDDVWVFVDKREGRGHFWALDLARDECGSMAMINYTPQAAGKSDLVGIEAAIAVNGPNGIFNIHTDELEYDIASGVLTATDGDFLAKGFKEGMTVIVETGNQSDPYFYAIVSAVTATSLAFTDTSLTTSTQEGKIHAMSKIVPQD